MNLLLLTKRVTLHPNKFHMEKMASTGPQFLRTSSQIYVFMYFPMALSFLSCIRNHNECTFLKPGIDEIGQIARQFAKLQRAHPYCWWPAVRKENQEREQKWQQGHKIHAHGQVAKQQPPILHVKELSPCHLLSQEDPRHRQCKKCQ